jgi:hypothetical protein
MLRLRPSSAAGGNPKKRPETGGSSPQPKATHHYFKWPNATSMQPDATFAAGYAYGTLFLSHGAHTSRYGARLICSRFYFVQKIAAEERRRRQSVRGTASAAMTGRAGAERNAAAIA